MGIGEIIQGSTCPEHENISLFLRVLTGLVYLREILVNEGVFIFEFEWGNGKCVWVFPLWLKEQMFSQLLRHRKINGLYFVFLNFQYL